MEELAIMNEQLDENYNALMQECDGDIMEEDGEAEQELSSVEAVDGVATQPTRSEAQP